MNYIAIILLIIAGMLAAGLMALFLSGPSGPNPLGFSIYLLGVAIFLAMVVMAIAARALYRVRSRGVKGLARMFWGTEREIGVLIQEIGSESDDLVFTALSDLIDLGTASNLPAPYLFSLLDRLQHEEKRSALRRRVIKEIIESDPLTSDAAARSVLETSIVASDRHERADALLAMGCFAAYPEEELSRRFVKLTRDPELVVRVAATHALASMAYDEDPELYGATDLFVRESVPAISVRKAYGMIDSARDCPGVFAVRALGSRKEDEASTLAVAWALSPSLTKDHFRLCVEVLLQKEGYNAKPGGKDLGFPLHVGQANAAKLLGAAAGRFHEICCEDTPSTEWQTAVVGALVSGLRYGQRVPSDPPNPQEYCAWALGMYGARAAEAQSYLLYKAQDDTGLDYLVEAIGRIKTKDVPVREILRFLKGSQSWASGASDKLRRVDVQCLLALVRLGATGDIPQQGHLAMINRLQLDYEKGEVGGRTERLMLEYLGLIGKLDPSWVALSLLEALSKEGNPLRKHALRAIARVARAENCWAAERAEEERLQLESERKTMEAEESAARDLVKTPRVRGLIDELAIIAEKSRFLADLETSEHSKRWGGAAKHFRAREIGEELQRLGGVSLMLEVHKAVTDRVGRYPHASELEWCWHEIDWRWGA